MSAPKRGRYVRRGVIDYIILALLFLLLLSIGARYITGEIKKREDLSVRASVSFVLRGIEKESVPLVSTHPSPFLFADNGTVLGMARFSEAKPSMMVLQKNDGTLESVPSDTHMDLYFTFTVDGLSAKDGTFLFAGARRLAAGDRFTLIRGDGRYESEFLRVQIL